MKKFLSALTAFCMSASLVASALPASALTPILTESPKAQAEGFTWDIEDDVQVETAANGSRVAYIDVFVYGDEGTNGFNAGILIEGKTFAEMFAENGMKLAKINKGDAYPNLSYTPNLDDGIVGAANNSDDQGTQIAADGATVMTYVVQIPDTVPDGVYDLELYEMRVGSGDGETILNPTLEAGTLIIGDVEPSETTPSETQDTGDKTEPTVGADAFTWDIADDVTPEVAANGSRVAYIDVYVYNDEGTNGFNAGMLIEGKTFAEMFAENGMKLAKINKGDAYPNLSYTPNLDDGIVGAANNSDDQGTQVAANGATVMTYVVQIPDTVPNGVYDLTLYEMRVGSGDGETILDPVLGAGTLVIGETEETSESEDATEPTNDGFMWDIADDVKPETAANGSRVAYIDVYVYGDPGTNGFNAGMLIEGKTFAEMFAENGMKLAKINKGDAYPNLSYTPNLDDGIVGAANNSPDQSTQVAADGATVMTFVVQVPDTVPAGTYDLTLYEMRIGSGDGETLLNPTLGAGTLVIGEEEPTEATEDTEFEGTTSAIDAKWIIGTVEAEAGATVTVPVTVTGDVDGINSYIAEIGQDAGPVLQSAEAGDAYAALNFVSNLDAMTFGATNYALGENVVAADNAVVFEMVFEVPANAAPGTVYDLTFDGLELYNIEMIQLIPTTEDGWIKVPDEEPTETEFEPTSSEIDAEWAIGTVEAEAGATVTVPVTVTGDVEGLNSYIMNMGQDEGPVAQSAEAGDAYAALNFVPNIADMEFGATDPGTGANVVAADGAVVFNVTFTVPADAAPGTIYDLTFEDLEIYNMDMVQLIPNTVDGWIKIPNEVTTEAAGEWIIGTTEAEAGETVTIPVTVKGDLNGINSYIMDMGQDEGPVAQGAEAGDAYAALDFVANIDSLTFAGTNYTLNENVIPADEAVVFYVTFTVPEDAEPGTIYNLTFENLEVFDINMSELKPEQTPGWIKIPEKETTTTEETTTTSEETTTTSEETTTTTEETTTTTTTEVTTDEAGMWIIGTTEVDAGATVTIPVTVKGDSNGINSYIFDMGQDAGPVAQGAEAGDAYAALDFVANLDTLTFGATNYTLSENVIPADDAVVLYVTFQVPENAAPGTIYNLTFENLAVFDINMSELTPAQQAGWIKIKEAESTTEESTTEESTTSETIVSGTESTYDSQESETLPTETESTTSEETTTTTEVTTNEAGMWIIGTTEVEAGATVTIPVTVRGDSNGINSYIFDMGQDAGPVAQGAEAGDAYAALDFVANLDTLTFGGTNYTLKENVIPADDAVVLYVTFQVPEDAAPGTIYNLTFENLTVFDINMSELTPAQQAGWIKIPEVESTTEESTTSEETTTESTTTESTTTESTTTESTTESTTSEETTTESTTTESTTTESTTTESTTTESTTTESTTESTTTESTTEEPVPGSATWQIGTVEAAPGETVTVDIKVYGDTGLNSYKFIMGVEEGPVVVPDSAAAGDAYAALAFQANLQNALALEFGATGAADVTDVIVAADGAVVLTVQFTVPEDAENGTVYDLTFNGDVEAYDADMVALNIDEQNGWIRVVKEDAEITGYRYEVTGKQKFYFSHDPRNFDPADLVETVTRYAIYSDGTEGEAEVITDFSGVQFNVPGWTNPEEVFNAQVLDENGDVKEGYHAYYTGSIPATLTDEFGVVHEFNEVGTAYIGVKGDATLTGEADANDAAIILVYAAAVGAGKEAYIYSDTDTVLEDFAYFLADVTGESEDRGATDSLGNERSDCDANDASYILVYAAIDGSGKVADWAEILAEPLPKYTAAIAEYKAANP